jgi:hypothetical protein
VRRLAPLVGVECSESLPGRRATAFFEGVGSHWTLRVAEHRTRRFLVTAAS